MLTVTKTIRDAEGLIARHKQKQAAPMVLWAGLTETAEDFARRVAAIRKRWTGRILAPHAHGYAVPASVQAVPFPEKLFRLLHPEADTRYRCASGGRGSGKSWAFAQAIVLLMITKKIRILACREIMRSLRESVHHLLVQTIETLDLSAFFSITDREVVCKTTKSEVIFSGLWQNTNQLKSLEGVGLAFIEEAESVSQRSLEILLPTIRAAGSEIWFGLNPDSPEAPIMEFVDGTRPDVRHTHMIFSDNPFFPPELESERAYMQATDDDAYRWIWLGECRQHSDAQVFAGKFFIKEFSMSPFSCDSGPLFGLDFGFSQSPLALTRCWISDNCLYIDYEAYALGCDLDRTPVLLDTIPGARQHTIRADCAAPGSISFLQRYGYPKIVACSKGPGSIADGIMHIRSYARVVIHPRCVHTIDNFRNYSYRVDKLTGDISSDPVDASNDFVDALRYALEPLIRPAGEWHFIGA
jgi:phage terminase large subunit